MRKRNSVLLKINLDIDFKFFAILPAINLNFGSKSLEFEWLFIGIYIDLLRDGLLTTKLKKLPVKYWPKP